MRILFLKAQILSDLFSIQIFLNPLMRIRMRPTSKIKVCFLVNLDDLLLYKWETWDKQLVDVDVVLERLRDNLIYTREIKCDFWVEMVYFSGFKASQATLMTE